MLTLLDQEETRIRSFVSKQLANTRNELEVRLFPQIPGQNITIDYYQFQRVLQRYTFEKDMGGFGLRKEFTTRLNVSSNQSPDMRESVCGTNAVKIYWLTESINTIQKNTPESLSRMSKKRKDNIDISNYPIRISLSEEIEIESKDEDYQFLNNKDFPKRYRLQNRISVFTEDELFRLDFTTVKTGEGKTFRQSRTLNAFPTYEIEIEYIGNQTVSKDKIFQELIQNLGTLLIVYYDSPILITKSLERDVLDNYHLLIRKNERLRNSNRKSSRDMNMAFIVANPRTLHRENCRDDPRTPNILRNYGVAYKADGVRMLLYVMPGDDENGGLFIFNNNFQVLPVGLKMSNWDNSVIEGEYIRDSHTFWAYDMLYAKGLDIRNKPLESFNESQSSRLTYLKDFVKDLTEKVKPENAARTVTIKAKPHLFGNGNEIFVRSRELWSKREAQPFHVDGLIFTPASDPYPDKIGTWDRLFKWKPPHLNTIDFLIETTKGTNNKDRLYPYIKLQTEEEKVRSTTADPITQYKILKLNVSGRIEKYNRRTARLRASQGPVLFQEAKVPVNTEGKIIARDPLSGITQEIMDDTIVEFSYQENSDFPWIPIRVRHGKTAQYRKTHNNFGNNERVARDIWRSIQVPVTAKMITSGEIPPPSSENEVRYTRDQTDIVDQSRLPYQTFHTVYVKDQLLRSVALEPPNPDRGAGYLIDFGSSRGGDLRRWKDIGYASVVGIDIDPDSVEQSTLRYERMQGDKDLFNVNFLCGDLTKLIFPNYESACFITEEKTESKNWKELMKLNLPQKYMFDVVSSQFVIHYSFVDELSLRTYFQNVTDNLRIGGYFVGTTFDGQRVYDALKRRKNISGSKGKDKIWEITKLYGSKKFISGKSNLGMVIDVYVSTIGIAHKEYLVSYPYMAEIAKEYGLELQQVTPFSEYWNEGVEIENKRLSTTIRAMSEAEKQFSFFFSSFAFKKITQAPETTYKKLVKLQRKIKQKENKTK